MKIGNRVIIKDYSEAHGLYGVVFDVQDNGIILVELDTECVWPVDDEYELEVVVDEDQEKS